MPDYFGVVDPASGYQLYKQSIDVDIPLCPHAKLYYLYVSGFLGLTSVNVFTHSTLGLGPIGFTLSGVPLRGPYTENLIRVDQDPNANIDT